MTAPTATRWRCHLCGQSITTHVDTSPPVCSGRHTKAVEMKPEPARVVSTGEPE